MKYQRRTDDDRIAELNAKIEGIRERAVRRAARADPAHQQARIALRALEKALRDELEDTPLVTAMTTARDAIRGSLDAHAPKPVSSAPTPRERPRKAKEPATA